MLAKLIARILPLNILEKMYLEEGICIGEISSYVGIVGEPIGWKRMENRFKEIEQEYMRRGFKPIPQDAFINCGGYGIPISPELVRQKA